MFCLYAVNSGNHTFELQMRINRVRVEFCHLSNQTIKCASFVRLFFVYGNKRGIREGDMPKKIAGCLIFFKKGAFVWDQDPHPLADRHWSKMLGSKNVFHIIT